MAITTKDLQNLFAIVAGDIAEKRDYLCELDGLIGDGDHGLAMDAGCQAATRSVSALDNSIETPNTVFNTAARAFLNAVGASSGPLYATAFMRAGAAVKGTHELDDEDFVNAFVAMAQGIQERGKAELGEKTMIDAWKPAADAASSVKSNGSSLQLAFAAALDAARDGCEATRKMLATKGRSARLGERVLGHIDPGAASAVIIIGAFDRFVRQLR